MFWLIWIALMLVVPVLAGLHVWMQLRREPREGMMGGTTDEPAAQ